MTGAKRRLGPIGTSLRALVATGLLYLAGGAHGLAWSVTWYDATVGLAGLPALTILLGLAARHHSPRSIRSTGPLAHTLNCALIVALATNPYTGDAVSLFYGAALLGAAWRAQPGCEVTVLSNWILHRDDQVGCPLFGPIDAAEGRHRRRALRSLSAQQ